MLKRRVLAAFWMLTMSAGAVSAQQTAGSLLTPPGNSAAGELRSGGEATALSSTRRDQSAIPRESALRHESLYDQLAAEVSQLERMQRVVQLVSRAVRPSVVHIEASKVELSGGQAATFDEAGSGVIVERAGRLWVITNRHVIAGAEPNEIKLRLSDGRTTSPLAVRADASTDVAILRIADVDAPVARVGASRGVGIGDFVLAVGSPFGLSHSVTFGIVSATGRRDLTLGSERIELQDFFQTDAAINPGNSGGPLLNLRGEVIGLNTAIASSSGGSEGIGFAIPMDMVMRVVDQLIEFGRVRRAYLGVSLAPDFDAAAARRLGLTFPGGARVKTVRGDSPAMLGGIRVGDVITQFDGVTIEDDDHLVTRVGLTPIGKEVDVLLYRDGQPYQTTVTVTPLP